MPQTFEEIRAFFVERCDALAAGDPGDHQQGHAALEAVRAVFDWVAKTLPVDQQTALADVVNKAWGLS